LTSCIYVALLASASSLASTLFPYTTLFRSSAYRRPAVYLDCSQHQGSGACLMTTSTQTTSSCEPNSAATTEFATSLASCRKKRARQYWALVTLLVIAVIGVWLASLMIG